jgi:hypothetical protein
MCSADDDSADNAAGTTLAVDVNELAVDDIALAVEAAVYVLDDTALIGEADEYYLHDIAVTGEADEYYLHDIAVTGEADEYDLHDIAVEVNDVDLAASHVIDRVLDNTIRVIELDALTPRCGPKRVAAVNRPACGDAGRVDAATERSHRRGRASTQRARPHQRSTTWRRAATASPWSVGEAC